MFSPCYLVNFSSPNGVLLTILSEDIDEILSGLEDALYIEFELEPSCHDWQDELMLFGSTRFDYWGIDYVEVFRTEDPAVFLLVEA